MKVHSLSITKKIKCKVNAMSISNAIAVMFSVNNPSPHSMSITIEPATVENIFQTCYNILMQSLPILFPEKVCDGNVLHINKLTYSDYEKINTYFNAIGINMHLSDIKPKPNPLNDLTKFVIYVKAFEKHIYFD